MLPAAVNPFSETGNCVFSVFLPDARQHCNTPYCQYVKYMVKLSYIKTNDTYVKHGNDIIFIPG